MEHKKLKHRAEVLKVFLGGGQVEVRGQDLWRGGGEHWVEVRFGPVWTIIMPIRSA
jgi:hypothetical protein